MTHFKSPVRYNVGHPGSGNRSQFAGLPVGFEAISKYYTFDPFARLDDDTIPGAGEEPGNAWTNTAVSAGTGTSAFTVSSNLTPPRLVATTAANEDDGIQTQYTAASGAGDFFDLAAGKLRFFEASFLLHDANDDADTVEQCDLFLGVCVPDTTVLGGATDYIGFHKADGSGAINFVAGKNSTSLGDQISESTAITLAAANAGTANANLTSLSFVASGTDTVFIYANGSFVSTVSSSTQFPDDVQLTPTMAFLSGEAVVKNMSIAKFVTSIEI